MGARAGSAKPAYGMHWAHNQQEAEPCQWSSTGKVMGTWRGEGVLLGDLVVRDQGGQGARSVGIGGCLW